MKDFIIPFVLMVVSSAITFILTRQKNVADIKKTELETVEIAVKIWREMAQDFETKLEQMEDKYNDLLNEVRLLRAENKKLKASNQ